MASSHRFIMGSLALALASGLAASQATAADPSPIVQITTCAPSFCGYLIDGDGADPADFDGDVTCTAPSCTGEWAPTVHIATTNAAVDTLTVSMAAINHPANPIDLGLNGPGAVVTISGDATLATPGCYTIAGLPAGVIGCTRSMFNPRWRVRHLPRRARYDYGGLAVTAIIDTATDQILRYHMNFGAQHGN